MTNRPTVMNMADLISLMGDFKILFSSISSGTSAHKLITINTCIFQSMKAKRLLKSQVSSCHVL